MWDTRQKRKSEREEETVYFHMIFFPWLHKHEVIQAQDYIDMPVHACALVLNFSFTHTDYFWCVYVWIEFVENGLVYRKVNIKPMNLTYRPVATKKGL